MVKERRDALGMSQEELAAQAGTSQGTIDKIENDRSLRSKFLPAVFNVLGLPLELLTNDAAKQAAQAIVPRDSLVGGADLPIYTAVRAGAIDDSILVSPDPIDYVKRPEPLARATKGYGLYVIGDSMEPAFRQGDLALVHPNVPPKAGDEVVVCSIDTDGEHYAVIKLLTKVTADKWHLRQYNPGPGEPAEFTLDRREWPTCHLVVGNYRRR